MQDDEYGFSSLSDEDLDAAIFELTDKEADDSERAARSLERKNQPVAGVGGLLTMKVRDIQYRRRKIQWEETAKALAQATAEKAHREDIAQYLPALVSEAEKVEQKIRQRNEDAHTMQSHIEAMAILAKRLEETEENLRRSENFIESRSGNFRGVVRVGGTGFRADELAIMLKTSMAMAFRSSKTYGRNFRISGLTSPPESKRDFAAVIRANGERLIQKFQREIQRIKERQVA